MRSLFLLFCILLSVPSQAQKKATLTEKRIATPVCESPQVKAYFPYGQDSIAHYIKLHSRFRDVGDKTTGKATVVFIVETDGSILHAEIFRTSGNQEFDREAVRIVKTISDWKPALNKGEAVRSTDMLSVTYDVR